MWICGEEERAKGVLCSTLVKYKVSVGSGCILYLLKRGGRVTTEWTVLDRREEYARANAEYSAAIQSLHIFPNAGYILSMHKADTSASETTELKEEVLSSTCLIAPVLCSVFISSQWFQPWPTTDLHQSDTIVWFGEGLMVCCLIY